MTRIDRLSSLHRSPQWRDGRFRNVTPWEWMSFSQYAGMMYEYIFKGGERTPKSPLPVFQADLAPFSDRGGEQLNATWLGHSTLLLNIDGVRIVTDPVFAKGITILGPWRYSGPVPVDIDAIPDIDILLLSHNHVDHLNEFTIRRLKDRVGIFVAPLGVGLDLEACGVDRANIVELDWWQAYSGPTGLRITATPAQHFSGRTMTDRDKKLWASFVIEGPHHKVFFGGDSGYFDGFKQIGEQHGPFDICFVETGAYSRFWHAVHMFPEEAVQAHCDLKGNVLHPIHWGTFNLSLHTWYDPMRRVVKAAREKGIRTATPIVGQTTVFDSSIPDVEWWEDVLAGSR